MPTSSDAVETALQQLVAIAQEHTSEFVNSLPLRDSDLAELNRALLSGERGRQKLHGIQQQYLQRWFEILQSEAASQRPSTQKNRLSAQQWSELPWFRTIRAIHELNASYISQVTQLTDLPSDTQRRLEFFARHFVDAMSPANFPLTNPQAIARALETGGDSLERGARAFAEDLARGRITMSDESGFEIGRNLAITPGDVIFENELIQLIQYRPTTKQVCSRALLIVPPFINKYYILDLQPHNSFVRYCVSQGITTFMISWRNIPAELGHLTWEDYIDKGIFKSIDVVKSISRRDSVNALGYCVGGTLLSCALAVKAARGEHPASSLTLLASMLDFSDTGDIGVYVDDVYVDHCEQRYAKGGLVPGSQLANAFASLRANELVWYFVINNYLLGNAPRAFDLLYWNADSANLPGCLYVYYLRNMYLENRLSVPGALRMKNETVDLRRLVMPAMVVATRDDHIVPWQSAYRSARLLGGKTEFVLGASGHVAGIINPAEANKRQYWVKGNNVLPVEPGDWLARAREIDGSWWPHWMDWLQNRSGKNVSPRKTSGNRTYGVVEPAPGRYVRERDDQRV